jgi:hypothetical protein
VTDREAEAGRLRDRAVWRLEGPLERTGEGEARRATLVVDKVTLAPMQLDLTDGERLLRSIRFDHVDLAAASTGSLEVDRTGAEPQVVDHGFRRVSLRDAIAAAGPRPLRPTYLPAGFELVDIALDPGPKVVSLRYQRGLEHVVVSTRPTAAAPSGDPFVRADPVGSDAVHIERGPFRDVEARRTMTVLPAPALWGRDRDVAFTISGDLTADQLVRVAESMR